MDHNKYQKRNKRMKAAWTVLVVLISLSMIFALVLPFVDLGY